MQQPASGIHIISRFSARPFRAFWNFCFSNIDNSANSTTYGDGYTFALMQANNPTTYCGTGNNDSAQTPYDCQYSGALGEFLSYCGLPGNNLAVEFDIYPNTTRADPTGNYNHIAFVQSLSTHTGPTHAGTYGDNTHNVWGNPACGTTLNPACNGVCTGGTCTGFCNGAAVTNTACTGTCYGTCNSPGSLQWDRPRLRLQQYKQKRACLPCHMDGAGGL